MTNTVEPDDEAAARLHARTGRVPPLVFEPDGTSPTDTRAASAGRPSSPGVRTDAGPDSQHGADYWTQPAPATHTAAPISTAGMPAFMSPLGVASVIPAGRTGHGRIIAAAVAALVLAGGAAFGIVEVTRHHSAHRVSLPAEAGGQSLNQTVAATSTRNSVDVLVSDPVQIADFLASATYGYYGSGPTPDLLVAAGPTSAVSAPERTALAQPPTGNAVVVYPQVGLSGVQVWCAPTSLGQKGYGCLWSDATVTCLVYDFDAPASMDAYRLALELRSELE